MKGRRNRLPNLKDAVKNNDKHILSHAVMTLKEKLELIYRKQMSDDLKRAVAEFIEHAKGQGSKNSSRYKGIFRRLIFKKTEKHKKEDVEGTLKTIIKDGIREGLPYKEIYQNCKKGVE